MERRYGKGLAPNLVMATFRYPSVGIKTPLLVRQRQSRPDYLLHFAATVRVAYLICVLLRN